MLFLTDHIKEPHQVPPVAPASKHREKTNVGFFLAINMQVFKEMTGRLSKGNRADYEPFVQASPWEQEAGV